MALPRLQRHSLSNRVTLGYLAAPPVPNPALPTLLLLHPFITDSSFFAPQFTDPLLGGEAGYKWNIIAIDIHGHGSTSGRSEFTYWDNAKDIALFLDDHNIRAVIVCGTSQGGFIGTRLAMLRPDLVSRLVYAGSTLLVDGPGASAGIEILTTGFPDGKEKLRQGMQSGFGVDPFAPGASDREKEEGKKWIAVWRERYGGSPEKVARMRGCVKQLLQRDDVVPRLRELTTMVDVLHGENDVIYSVDEHAKATKRLLEKNGVLGSYRILKGGPHYISWGLWEEVDKKLVEIMNAQAEGMRLGYV